VGPSIGLPEIETMATLPIVNTFDKRVGVIASILTMLLLFLLMLSITYEKADPPPEDIPINMSEPMDVTEIENIVIQSDGGGGGGSASENQDAPPKQTEQVIASNQPSSTTVNAGQGNVSNSNENNPPAGDNTENHFGDGGSDGQGGGSGGPFGADNGNGNEGSGSGAGGGNRKVITEVNFSLDYDNPVTFSFRVLIDQNGNVMSAQVIKGSTTTTDQVLINKVSKAVKRQVKYSKSAGSPAITKIYTFKLRPI